MTTSSTRRTFMLHTALASAGTLLAANAQAKPALVAQTDTNAVALGYKEDATKVDKAKYPKFAVGQSCANCGMYQGAKGAETGGCPIFTGKQVSAKAWCSAWMKKA
jgi:hypothetical protein